MGKGLDHLEALDHLLDVAVDITQGILLLLVIPAAASAEDLEDQEGGTQSQNRYQKEQRAHHQHDHHDAHEHDSAGDQGDQTLLQSHLDIVGVVGEAAHEFAVGVLVEVGQRKGLEVVKEVFAQAVGAPLGQLDHDGRLGVDRHHTHQIDAYQLEDIHKEVHGAGIAAVGDVVDDDEVDEGGAANVGAYREQQAHQHQKKGPLPLGKVAQQAGDRPLQVLGLFKAAVSSRAPPGRAVCIGHYSFTPSC